MDDNKNAKTVSPELSDEALDQVAGGATCKYDMITKRWFVYRRDGSYYGDYANELAARGITRALTQEEYDSTFEPPFKPDPEDHPGY